MNKKIGSIMENDKYKEKFDNGLSWQHEKINDNIFIYLIKDKNDNKIDSSWCYVKDSNEMLKDYNFYKKY